MGGQKKRPLFQKPKKWGISTKKKKGAKWGDNKTRPFLKNGVAQNKKNGRTPGWREKIQIFSFQKKKRWGENGRKVKIPHFLKMGVKKTKKRWGRPPFFWQKKIPHLPYKPRGCWIVGIFILEFNISIPCTRKQRSRFQPFKIMIVPRKKVALT